LEFWKSSFYLEPKLEHDLLGIQRSTIYVGRKKMLIDLKERATAAAAEM